MTKITGLSAHNVAALNECFSTDQVTTTTTTATFTMDAAEARQLVLDKIGTLSGRGHPKASLWAVERRLKKEMDE